MKKIAKAVYSGGARIVPRSLKPVLQPFAKSLRQFFESAAVAPDLMLQPVKTIDSQQCRPRVLHVIANFMLGGSSRLVMDLVENLGDEYDHKVVTCFLPSPPAYVGVDITELRSPRSHEDVLTFLREYSPNIVHVHYWGDCDFWWYDILFKAAQTLGCRVIENVNTPVAPYQVDFIDYYVHVSSYVQRQFGDGSAKNMTIYPGSDFSLFAKHENYPVPSDCIGMVYRLENDKLNKKSIDVFVKVVQRRPKTKVIIVGGGSYLEHYRKAAQKGGVESHFEFTGYVEYAKLPRFYARLNIFVAPVWKESFGQVSAFAMNMNIPVVGYNIGGLAEIVQDPSLLAMPENSDELAEIIIQLLDDPERCRQIGLRNAKRAQSVFSVEAMINSYGKLYADLIGTSK